MYRLYRKRTIYGHFSILSKHFCLNTFLYTSINNAVYETAFFSVIVYGVKPCEPSCVVAQKKGERVRKTCRWEHTNEIKEDVRKSIYYHRTSYHLPESKKSSLTRWNSKASSSAMSYLNMAEFHTQLRVFACLANQQIWSSSDYPRNRLQFPNY